MTGGGPDDEMAALIEDLAAAEHERWAHWQRYVHQNGSRQLDGSLLLPADLVSRWERQMTTAYGDLTEREKDSDREQVYRYLPIVWEALKNHVFAVPGSPSVEHLLRDRD